MIEKDKILVVDDKHENLVAMEKLLAVFDVEIYRAYSGNEALSLTLNHDFALALIDVQMPDMDGYETVKLMRQVEKTHLLPVIFVSAIYSENHYLIQGIEAGAVDFITKPIVPRMLIGKIRIFLDLHKQKLQLEKEIDARKKSEEALRKTEKKLLIAKAKAEEADKLKSAFLANMSHEIRTPMNAIIGFSNLLSDPYITDKDKNEYIQYINKSSEALLSLIDDIIDIAKIEAGELKIVAEPVEVNSLMKEMYITYLEELKRKGKKHVNLILEKTVSDNVVLQTDEFRFRQILINLLNNAIKFTEKGQISFGYQVKKNRKVIEFFVKDSGIGIPEDKYDLIFERFQRITDSRLENTTGTGLGLSIVKKILELQNGHIWIESIPDQGSAFLFTLPYDPGRKEEIPAISNKKPLHVTQMPDWENRKIVIAEDEYLNFVFLKEALNPTKIEVIWAKNGREVIDIVMKENVDLVLMDIKMPIMTGYEASSVIRKSFDKLPIIAQTAYAMMDEKERCLDSGFTDYLTKPINPRQLISTVDKYL